MWGSVATGNRLGKIPQRSVRELCRASVDDDRCHPNDMLHLMNVTVSKIITCHLSRAISRWTQFVKGRLYKQFVLLAVRLLYRMFELAKLEFNSICLSLLLNNSERKIIYLELLY